MNTGVIEFQDNSPESISENMILYMLNYSRAYVYNNLIPVFTVYRSTKGTAIKLKK